MTLPALRDRFPLPWFQASDKVKCRWGALTISNKYDRLASNVLSIPAVDKREPGDETSRASNSAAIQFQDSQ
jgi:hypothetical protein